MSEIIRALASGLSLLGYGVIVLSISGCVLGLVGGVAFVVGRAVAGWLS